MPNEKKRLVVMFEDPPPRIREYARVHGLPVPEGDRILALVSENAGLREQLNRTTTSSRAAQRAAAQAAQKKVEASKVQMDALKDSLAILRGDLEAAKIHLTHTLACSEIECPRCREAMGFHQHGQKVKRGVGGSL